MKQSPAEEYLTFILLTSDFIVAFLPLVQALWYGYWLIARAARAAYGRPAKPF